MPISSWRIVMVHEAVQQVRMLRGHTKPHLFFCDDRIPYVVKLSSSVQPERRLASEYVATQLSRWVGLPTPEGAIISVSQFLLDSTPDLSASSMSTRYRPGLHFGSRLVGWGEEGSLSD